MHLRAAEAFGDLSLGQIVEKSQHQDGAKAIGQSMILDACARAGFVPRRIVQTTQVAAAGHLAAAGLGVTLIPDNIVPAGLRATTRSLRPPLVRKLFAYTRSEWPPLAGEFLDAIKRLPWPSKPADAYTIP